MDSRRSSLKSQSSGNSKTDDHKHASNNTTEKPGPTSALLQDLLRAQKAESRRASERNNVDSRKTRRSYTEPHHPQAHISPLSPPAPANGMQPEGKYYRRSSGVGLRHAGTREMGARETEEYISKLNKENFSLKLDVFQSRKRADSLNAKLENIEAVLENMKTLETENRELRDINDQLVKELENKDQAIKEAVTIICNLEDKMERVELAPRDTKPSTASPTPKPSTASHHPSSSPELPLRPVTSKKRASAGTTKPEAPLTDMSTNRHINVATPIPVKAPRRTPSFLPTTRDSASAIRSIYQHENMSSIHLSALSLPRPGSLYSLATTINPASPFDDGISSPRLSILSESSF
ncbi:MAG: hypothetical protein LQ347_006838, partial [Umbilicaria vellea]